MRAEKKMEKIRKAVEARRNEGEDSSSDKPARKRQYHCEQCSATFKKSRNLKQHTISHIREKHFVCYKCRKQFISQGSLNNHQRGHEDSCMFQCGESNMVPTTAGSVRRHMAVHQK